MINRRHIRIKVMQNAFAYIVSEEQNLDRSEGYLVQSIEALHNLYLYQNFFLIALQDKAKAFYNASQNKYIPTNSALFRSKNFMQNRLLVKMRKALYEFQNTLNKNIYSEKWEAHAELVHLVWNQIIKDKEFLSYLELDKTDFAADKKILKYLYKNYVAPSEALSSFYEDEVISWASDIPYINTWIYNNLEHMGKSKEYKPDSLFKDLDDQEFALDLFRKTVLNFTKYEKDINEKTPNWDSERITLVDKIMIVMGIVEFIHIPSIPTKVSINEYIEIAKEYASHKSSTFINGVLDSLRQTYQDKNLINKTGRGLL